MIKESLVSASSSRLVIFMSTRKNTNLSIMRDHWQKTRLRLTEEIFTANDAAELPWPCIA